MNTAIVPMNLNQTDLYSQAGKALISAPSGIRRTSNLDAPIMLLVGHDSEVFCCKFSPSGEVIASSGFDRQIFVWSTYGECENLSVMQGKSGAILELQFNPDGTTLYSASTDKTIAIWDLETGTRIKRLKGHQSIVNSCDCARRGLPIICSGSDDGTVRMWDTRLKEPIHVFQSTYQVTALCFSDTAEQIFSGGIDNVVKVWDIRKNGLLNTMPGHTDTVTGVELSPDGSYLLSNAMDSTLRMWDVRPFAPQERCVKIIAGVQHTFEKNLLRCCWSPDGQKISAGSGDRFVYIWNTTSRKIIYKLPGHAGSVNQTDFHPTEPIILSGSSDKKIYMGEIEP